MPRDNDKNNAPPRGTRGAGRHVGKGGGKGRDGGGGGRSRDERPARRDGKSFGEKKSFGDKPFGDRKPGAKRPYAARPASDRPRSDRPFAGKSDRFRDEGDRPRPRFNRDESGPSRGPRKEFEPRRDFKPREERGGDDRPRFKPREDRGGEGRPRFKPREDRGGERPFTPRSRDDRAPRGERSDARPAGRFGDKKFGDKRPYAAKGEGFRKDGDRPFSHGPRKEFGARKEFGPRKEFKPREDFAGRDRSEEKPWQRRTDDRGPPREGRGFDKPRFDKPRDDRPRRDGDDRPRFSRSRDDRPDRSASEDRGPRKFSRPRDDRFAGDRPKFDRPKFDRPRGERGSDDRPKFDRPKFDRPKFDRPRGERNAWQEHPRSDHDERPRGEQDDSQIFVKRPAFGGRGAYRERKPETDKRAARPAAPEKKKAGERIAKLLARSGLCSRRDAEEWIMQGRVAVNGRVLTSPALDITERDVVTVDGQPLPERERTRLFLYHKPRGLMTTHADPEGRPTVFDNLPEHLPRLISIGRLDFNTEGLLLLTNDGGLARALELPDTGWLRRYRVRAHGTITQARLDELRKGVEVDGVKYGSIDAQLEHDQGANVWIVFAIREGKNREVRNVMAHLGLEVNRLIRVSYGPFQLAELPEGEVEEVKTRVLREQLGEKIAGLAGADFGAAVQSEGAADGEIPHRPKPAKPRVRKSMIADRKGRQVLVQRSGERDEDAGERPYRRPKRGYHGKRDIKPRD
jgi:23S rRNA pseudouridine2605 synthase